MPIRTAFPRVPTVLSQTAADLTARINDRAFGFMTLASVMPVGFIGHVAGLGPVAALFGYFCFTVALLSIAQGAVLVVQSAHEAQIARFFRSVAGLACLGAVANLAGVTLLLALLALL